MYFDDEEDPEDGDGDVGGEEHVEAEVETVVDKPGHDGCLVTEDVVDKNSDILDTNILKNTVLKKKTHRRVAGEVHGEDQ